MLLIREICEKQLSSIHQTLEEKDQREDLIKLYINLIDLSTKLIDSSNRIMFCIYRMPIEKYAEATTKLMAWSKYITINKFL
jgi:predicted translin family RNA/ssDNA-binding protein